MFKISDSVLRDHSSVELLGNIVDPSLSSTIWQVRNLKALHGKSEHSFSSHSRSSEVWARSEVFTNMHNNFLESFLKIVLVFDVEVLHVHLDELLNVWRESELSIKLDSLGHSWVLWIQEIVNILYEVSDILGHVFKVIVVDVDSVIFMLVPYSSIKSLPVGTW